MEGLTKRINRLETLIAELLHKVTAIGGQVEKLCEDITSDEDDTDVDGVASDPDMDVDALGARIDGDTGDIANSEDEEDSSDHYLGQAKRGAVSSPLDATRATYSRFTRRKWW